MLLPVAQLGGFILLSLTGYAVPGECGTGRRPPSFSTGALRCRWSVWSG